MFRQMLAAFGAAIGLTGIFDASAAAEADFIACRSVVEAAARLACYDHAASTTAGTESPPPGAASPAPEALFGLSPQEVQKVAEEQYGMQTADALTATVTAMHESATGKLTLDLDNGQRWEQTDSQRLHIKAGDAVHIRRAALGSYLLQRVAGGPGVRFRRIQ